MWPYTMAVKTDNVKEIEAINYIISLWTFHLFINSVNVL